MKQVNFNNENNDAKATKKARLTICDADTFSILESAFKTNLITYFYKNTNQEKKDIYSFLINKKAWIVDYLKYHINDNEAIKFSLVLECTYERISRSRI